MADAAPIKSARDDGGSTRPSANGSSRAALACFYVLAATAVPLYLILGRKQWFFLDEWDFLVSRSAGNVSDLLRPHDDHWTTLPILAWRALWQVGGLRSYLPYETLSVILHVAVAALCRAVMRRAQVRPWVATFAAGAFLFFGAGAQNIFYAFQITFTGAIMFGFAQLLLADHDGPLDRRDWLGLGAGLLGLMCSGVAVAMVVVVGIATGMRRGLRVAAFHTAPLALIYLAWWARYGRSETKFTGTLGRTLGFARAGIDATFGALGRTPGVGAALGFVLIGGMILRWRAGDASNRKIQMAIPTSLVVGAVFFFLITGVGRTGGHALLDDPSASRYVYVAGALLLPVIAIAVDALLRRSRAIGIAALALLLVGVPGNLASASDFARTQARVTSGTRSTILSVGRMPISDQVPPALRPVPYLAPLVTMRWIRAGVRSGRIPSGGTPSPETLATNRLRLSLMELDARTGRQCPPLTRPITRRLALGERMSIGTGTVQVSLPPTGPRRFPVRFGDVLFGTGQISHTLVSVIGPLTLRVGPVRGRAAQLC